MNNLDQLLFAYLGLSIDLFGYDAVKLLFWLGGCMGGLGGGGRESSHRRSSHRRCHTNRQRNASKTLLVRRLIGWRLWRETGVSNSKMGSSCSIDPRSTRFESQPRRIFSERDTSRTRHTRRSQGKRAIETLPKPTRFCRDSSPTSREMSWTRRTTVVVFAQDWLLHLFKCMSKIFGLDDLNKLICWIGICWTNCILPCPSWFQIWT